MEVDGCGWRSPPFRRLINVDKVAETSFELNVVLLKNLNFLVNICEVKLLNGSSHILFFGKINFFMSYSE